MKANEAEEIASMILAEMLAAAAASDDGVVFDDEQIAYVDQALSDAAQEAINRRAPVPAQDGELLAACKEALDHLDGSPVEVHEAFAVLHAAIAHAEGRKPGLGSYTEEARKFLADGTDDAETF